MALPVRVGPIFLAQTKGRESLYFLEVLDNLEILEILEKLEILE